MNYCLPLDTTNLALTLLHLDEHLVKDVSDIIVGNILPPMPPPAPTRCKCGGWICGNTDLIPSRLKYFNCKYLFIRQSINAFSSSLVSLDFNPKLAIVLHKSHSWGKYHIFYKLFHAYGVNLYKTKCKDLDSYIAPLFRKFINLWWRYLDDNTETNFDECAKEYEHVSGINNEYY